jgi:hypothetical protein
MLENIENLDFTKKQLEIIQGIENAYNIVLDELSKRLSFNEFVKENIKEELSEEDSFFKDLTEKEQILYVLGTLSGIIMEKTKEFPL